nr:hypothetical protein [Marseillevirus cajuinensis]
MESALLPKVYQLLEEEFLVEKPDVVMSSEIQSVFTVKFLRVSIALSGKQICSWSEFGDRGETVFSVPSYIHVKNVEEALQIIREVLNDTGSPLPRLLIEKHKNIIQEKKELLEKIEKLRRKKRELKYRPGNEGALNAQKHFEHLVVLENCSLCLKNL